MKSQSKFGGPLASEMQAQSLNSSPPRSANNQARRNNSATQLTPPTNPKRQSATTMRAEFKAAKAKFTAKFGADKGAAWEANGRTYESCV